MILVSTRLPEETPWFKASRRAVVAAIPTGLPIYSITRCCRPARFGLSPQNESEAVGTNRATLLARSIERNEPALAPHVIFVGKRVVDTTLGYTHISAKPAIGCFPQFVTLQVNTPVMPPEIPSTPPRTRSANIMCKQCLWGSIGV